MIQNDGSSLYVFRIFAEQVLSFPWPANQVKLDQILSLHQSPHNFFFLIKRRQHPNEMVAKAAKTSKKSKAATPLKSPKTGKEVKTPSESVQKEKDRLQTGLNSALVEKAVAALVKHHESQTDDKKSLLGNDASIQLQITLLRTPAKGSPKPIRLMIPHPLYQLADSADNDHLEEREICLIVKEESKPWCQEMIEKFPEHMGCVKKVLGLQSLRKKHARFEQRRELLNKYNFFAFFFEY